MTKLDTNSLHSVINRFLPWAVGLSIVLTTFFINFRQLIQRTYPNDLIAWLLPAAGTLKGFGVPYLQYWDIKPPGLLLMTTVWGFFSTSMAWFHLLNMLLINSILWMYWRFLRKVFHWFISLILFGFTTLIFSGYTVHSQFLPSELYGLFWVFLGLTLLTSKIGLGKRVFLASLAFGLAGQMKEVFTFSFLSLLPLFITVSLQNWKQGLKLLLISIAGMGVVVAVLVGYLQVTGTLTAYREVMAAKSLAFSVKDIDSVFYNTNFYKGLQSPKYRFMRTPYNSVVLVMLGLGAVWILGVVSQRVQLTKNAMNETSLNLQLDSRSYYQLIVVCWWLGLLIGYVVQNKFGSMYDLAVLFSSFAFTGLLAVTIGEALGLILEKLVNHFQWSVRPWLKLAITTLVVVIITIPHFVYVKEVLEHLKTFSPQFYVQRWQQLETPDQYAAELTIKERTQPDACIEAIYGWAIGKVYYYAQRRPCARHFIPNIITSPYFHEYRESVIAQPPRAIYYTRSGADLDIETFEHNVFPYTKVMAACYEPDPQFAELYWPRPELQNETDLQTCVKETTVAHFSAAEVTAEVEAVSN